MSWRKTNDLHILSENWLQIHEANGESTATRMPPVINPPSARIPPVINPPSARIPPVINPPSAQAEPPVATTVRQRVQEVMIDYFGVSLPDDRLVYLSKDPRTRLLQHMIDVDPEIAMKFDNMARKLGTAQGVDSGNGFGQRQMVTDIQPEGCEFVNEAATADSIQVFASKIGLPEIDSQKAQEAAARWPEFIEDVKGKLGWDYQVTYTPVEDPGTPEVKSSGGTRGYNMPGGYRVGDSDSEVAVAPAQVHPEEPEPEQTTQPDSRSNPKEIKAGGWQAAQGTPDEGPEVDDVVEPKPRAPVPAEGGNEPEVSGAKPVTIEPGQSRAGRAEIQKKESERVRQLARDAIEGGQFRYSGEDKKLLRKYRDMLTSREFKGAPVSLSNVPNRVSIKGGVRISKQAIIQILKASVIIDQLPILENPLAAKIGFMGDWGAL